MLSKNKVLFYFTISEIFLIILSTGAVIITKELTITKAENINNSNFDFSTFEFEDRSTINEKSSPRITQSPISYIIFFDTKKEFNYYITNHSVLKSYPHLLAVEMKNKNLLNAQGLNILPNIYKKFDISPSIDNLSLDQYPSFPTLLNYNNLLKKGTFGTNITIGILDNGINQDVGSLNQKVISTHFSGVPNLSPCYNHATPVSSLIAADSSNKDIGIANKSKLIDVQFSCNGNSIEGDFLGAFDYILANNATIDMINTSFGGFAPTWDPILEKLERAGIIVVGSAGNSGPGLHSTTTGGPGNSVHAISVGSIDSNLQISSFSSRGPAYYMTTKPDLLAPGRNVLSLSSTDQEGSFTGTSFSSPIAVGVISNLLSVLKNEGISYNPGLIKAALLNSATHIDGSELDAGKGLINGDGAYDLIKNNPQLVSMSPDNAPIFYLNNVPRGQILKIPVTLVSSDPMNTQITFGGDLSSKNINYMIGNDYSQIVDFIIDTNQFSTNSEINGSITATVGSSSYSINVNFSVKSDYRATLGIDLQHTYWNQFGADNIGGSNIGIMIQHAMKNGYRVVELNTINTTTLQSIDVLWLPDPFNIINPVSSYSTDYLFSEGSLTTSQITLIKSKIETGMSLLVSSLGLELPKKADQSRIIGSNATELNRLISSYGISLSKTPIYFGASKSSARIANQSYLVKGINDITHYGNFLVLGNNAWSLAEQSGRPTLAYAQPTLNSGKVVVASTNIWLDNIGLRTNYGFNHQNVKMADSLWNWFETHQNMTKVSQKVEPDLLSGSFSVNSVVQDNFSLQSQRDDVVNTLTPISNNDGLYNFSVPIKQDGYFRVTVQHGTEYLAWEVIRDKSPPVWKISSQNANNSDFSNDSYIVLQFNVQDKYSGVNESSLLQSFDGSVSTFVTSFTNNSNTLQVIVDPFDLNPNSYHTLKLSISDFKGNRGFLLYSFTIDLVRSSIKDSTSSSMSRFDFDLTIIFPLLVSFAIQFRKGRKDHHQND